MTRHDTGPFVFEGDWPGVFIRGDDALRMANDLRMAIEHFPEHWKGKGSRLTGLINLLESCRVDNEIV